MEFLESIYSERIFIFNNSKYKTKRQICPFEKMFNENMKRKMNIYTKIKIMHLLENIITMNIKI